MLRFTISLLVFASALAACGPSGGNSAPAPALVPQEEMEARLAALPAPYNATTYEAGRRAFAQCASCHSITVGGENRVGPNLHGVFGRAAGAHEGFGYSPAVQNAGFSWDTEHLNHWLENPQTALPGNRMNFPGVRDEAQRRDLIAYLMADAAPTPPAQ